MNHVALVTDHGYAPWCAVAIRSIVANGGLDDVTIVVLHDGTLTADDIALLETAGAGTGSTASDRITVKTMAPDADALASLPAIGRFGAIVWLRFLLPALLADVDRLLYLDVDTLVHGSLAPLFSLDLQGRPIGAVPNVLPVAEWTRVVNLGLLEPADYFNSGVLLMDLAALRNEFLVERASDIAAALGARLVWPDQDVLNVLFAGRWAPLDASMNTQQSFFVWPELADAVIGGDARRAAVDSPTIIHFEGPAVCKPWHAWSAHPHRDQYRAMMAELDDPRVQPTAASRTSSLLAPVPDAARFRLYKTVQSARANPRREARRRLDAAKAKLGLGIPPDESWTPPDAAERLRPSRVSPHVLSTASDLHRSIVQQCRAYTMVGNERLLATIDGVEYVLDNEVPGDLAECGVWRGGSTLAMVLTLLAHGVTDRDIWLYDTFEGMTTPTEADVSRFDDDALSAWEQASQDGNRMFGDLFAEESFGLAQVRRLLYGTGYPESRIRLVQGPVEETIPAHAPEVLAFLRLDTDWYESTKHELDHLYPRITPGGVLIIDDYGHWDGARRAVDEYFATTERPLLSRSDYSGRTAVKR